MSSDIDDARLLGLIFVLVLRFLLEIWKRYISLEGNDELEDVLKPFKNY